MSYKTVEVELDNGRVRPRGAESLPSKGHGLLTILDTAEPQDSLLSSASVAGLKRFLSSPDFALTSEQFRASMEADFFEQ